jgi:hypothetical protein
VSVRIDKPFSAVCPRTGSRVFICDDLLELAKPIEVACPVCDHWHIWNPATLGLSESDATNRDMDTPRLN